MFQLLYIPIIGALDRFRGTKNPEGIGAIKKILLGIPMALAMGFEGWALALAALLSAASFANGWGAALGPAIGRHKNIVPPYENYWQGTWFNNILRREPLVAMAFRGVWASLFLLPLMYWNICVLAMVPLLALCYSIPTLLTDNWEHYELIRGCSIGLSCILIGLW